MTDTEKKEVRYLPVPVRLNVATLLDGKPLDAITMRPPTTNDILLAEKTTASVYDKDVLLYANLTDTSEEFICSLSYADYLQLDRAFELFLLPLGQHLEQHALFCPKPPGESASTNLPTSRSTS